MSEPEPEAEGESPAAMPLCVICGKRPQTPQGSLAAGMCANCYLYDQRMLKKAGVVRRAEELQAMKQAGIPPGLLDLRWVNEHPDTKGVVGTRQLLQKMREEKPGEFLNRLEAAEAAYRESQKPKGEAESQEDEGIERALELVDKWLEENEEVGGDGTRKG